MAGGGHHEAVGDADGEGADVDDGEPPERAERAEALQVEVEEGPAVVEEDKVPERVGALDREPVTQPMRQEPERGQGSVEG